MDANNSEEEIPSIIQEIVFYDKPNVKTVVPQSILPKDSPVPLGKGDIFISCGTKSSLPQTSTEKHQSDEKRNLPESNDKESSCSVKPSKEIELKQSKSSSTVDSLNHFINYENLGEESLKPGDSSKSNKKSLADTSIGKTSDKRTHFLKKVHKPEVHNDSPQESVQTESKRNKKNAKITEKPSPFKTPTRPIKKADKKSSQKVTMLNYVTKVAKPVGQKILAAKVISIKAPKDKPIVEKTSLKELPKTRIPKETSGKSDMAKSDIEKESSENSSEANKNSSIPKKKHTEMKRSRGRPRKSEIQVKTGDHHSDEDVSFSSPEKNKNYAELKNVPLDSHGRSSSVTEVVLNPDDLAEILEEAQEHAKEMDRVEKDLQSMFRNEQEEEPAQTGKGKRKAPGRKGKISKEVVKKVKKEVEEDEEEQKGEERETLDNIVVVEDYDSEEDSRSEWIPVEYAEYRQQHLMRHQKKTFPCKFCDQKFSSYYGMRKHRALDHDDVGIDRKEGSYKESVKCKQEKEQDDSDEESREEWLPQDYADYKMKHKMNQFQAKRVQWYKCKICCAVFSNYYKLSKHRIEHENRPNPYECKQCDARFKDVETLMAHIRVHQGKDPYQCRKCEKGFTTKEELDEHVPLHILKKGPTPPKRFRCDICSKEFSKLCDIERHTRVHTGEKPAECNICHKRFQQSHNLSKHLLTHLHVRPFQCEICNKKFGRVDVLNRHLLTHSMEKPFKCEVCQKGFIRQVQVTNHMEKIHSKGGRKSAPRGGYSKKEDGLVEALPEEEDEEDPFVTSGEEEVEVT